MSGPLGLDGTQSVDPVTFIVTLGGYIPAGFSILYAVCILLGLLMMAGAGLRQIETSRGRGETTTAQNLMHACFGAAIAIVAELIGAFGKGLFGEFEDASVLLYSTRMAGGSMSKVAMASFLLLVQFIGAAACIYSLRVADRITTNKPYPGETGASVFWFAFGGLCCVFVQQVIGILSALTGFGLARFINNL